MFESIASSINVLHLTNSHEVQRHLMNFESKCKSEIYNAITIQKKFVKLGNSDTSIIHCKYGPHQFTRDVP